MDEYEVRSIAEREAHAAAEAGDRELGYRLDRLQDDVDRLRRELESEREARRENDSILGDGSAELGGHVHELEEAVRGLQRALESKDSDGERGP